MISCIEGKFEVSDRKPCERGSPIMEGLLAEKDGLVTISIGLINEALDITLLVWLIMLAAELSLPKSRVVNLERNRSESQTALERMQ